MHRWPLCLLALSTALAAAPSLLMAKELPPRPSVADVIKGSKNADWRALDPDNTLYLELPAGRVV
ncbi:MAG TPA: peptidylprolyl isomerase, partial [Pseudoduganella sp.]